MYDYEFQTKIKAKFKTRTNLNHMNISIEFYYMKAIVCINLYQSIDLHIDQPPVDQILIAQLVEHCTGIAEVRVQITIYRIYSCISRPFTTKKSAQKIALDLYTSHTQRPDQAVQEISITTARSALGKAVIIVADFHQFSEHSSATKKFEIINVKWFKRRSTGDYFYCVF